MLLKNFINRVSRKPDAHTDEGDFHMPSPTDPRLPAPDFGRVSAEHAQTFIGIMRTLHTEPTASAFGRLLNKRPEAEDYILLAHAFEETRVVILNCLLP